MQEQNWVNNDLTITGPADLLELFLVKTVNIETCAYMSLTHFFLTPGYQTGLVKKTERRTISNSR